MAIEKSRPNWLLRGFIIISLGVHVIVFLHVAGIYESRAVSYIELSMHQISKPNYREIPKPRMRKIPPKVPDTKNVKMQKMIIPNIKIDTLNNNDQTYEQINLPSLPDNMDVSGYSMPGLKLENPVIQFTSAKEYFEMLNLRVHSFKEYPDFAKSRHIDGKVKVQFVLAEDGRMSNLKIIKSSRHKSLDNAALEAVKKASPFPRPPAFLFKTPVTLSINILFELV
ncbi:MAG: energy transducer TonB [Desulfobacteraceae bacterium]|nr:energy transducer TonB [Desulfobacteraceae bacterium]